VATKRQTQKYANIRQHPRLSLLVDNRTNQAGDFQQALAITILAAASEPAPAEYNLFLDLYLDKHPYMSGFCQSPDCALIKLTVDRYLVVSFLQKSPDSKEDYAEVRELQP
jgi:hypothetical protein